MVLKITYIEATRLVKAMGERHPIPRRDLQWFALYGGQRWPENIAYGHFTTNDDGLMGIMARECQSKSELIPTDGRVGAA